MSFEFKLPDIGEGIHEGEIVRWLIKAGDTVREDQAIVEVMTDKVTAEIPSPVSGVVEELCAKEGELVKVGAVIIKINQTAGATASTAKAEVKLEPVACSVASAVAKNVPNGNGSATPSKPAMPTVQRDAGEKVLAAPATRKLARTMGLDLQLIAGSGPRGRVTPDDVHNFKEGFTPEKGTPTPNWPASKPMATAIPVSQGDRRVPFAGMRRKIAEHLVKSKHTAPHFGYVEEVDMSELLKVREQLKGMAAEQNVKLTFLPFIIKAVIAGIKAYPIVNSQLDDTKQELVYKGDVNMGIAVATDDGLIVPVIKNADQKSLMELATEIKTLSDKARAGKLSLDEIKGGTFTLTSIGSIGGLFGIPIINHPEVAIMGINKITQRPVVRDNQIVIRDMMHLSLCCDHRVVDGAEAAQFTKYVIEYLENPTRLLLL